MFRPIAGLVGTYSDGKIEFADNGAVGGSYTLQGYCWVAFDSDGNPVGRADAVIPVNISFEKYAQTASVAAKSSAELSGRTVADRTNACDSRSQMLFGFDILSRDNRQRAPWHGNPAGSAFLLKGQTC